MFGTGGKPRAVILCKACDEPRVTMMRVWSEAGVGLDSAKRIHALSNAVMHLLIAG